MFSPKHIILGQYLICIFGDDVHVWLQCMCLIFIHVFHVLYQVVHIFSHIHQTYIVFSVRVSDWSEGEQEQKTCWLTKSALKEAAVSTGVKKVVYIFMGFTVKTD